MYRSILLSVALDRKDSDHARLAQETALALAKGTGAALTILTVRKVEGPAIDHLKPDAEEQFGHGFSDQLHKEVEAKLSQYAAPFEAEGISVNTLFHHGELRKTIIDTIEEVGADVLVIGSHNKRNILDVALGGTAHHLSAHAPCPVILVSP